MHTDRFNWLYEKPYVLEKIVVKTWRYYSPYSEIKFELSDGKNLLIQYRSNTEELVIKNNIFIGKGYSEVCYEELKRLYGLSPVKIWTMMHQQGYWDVVQLKFTDLKECTEKIIQLKAIGSIVPYIVDRVLI